MNGSFLRHSSATFLIASISSSLFSCSSHSHDGNPLKTGPDGSGIFSACLATHARSFGSLLYWPTKSLGLSILGAYWSSDCLMSSSALRIASMPSGVLLLMRLYAALRWRLIFEQSLPVASAQPLRNSLTSWLPYSSAFSVLIASAGADAPFISFLFYLSLLYV